MNANPTNLDSIDQSVKIKKSSSETIRSLPNVNKSKKRKPSRIGSIKFSQSDFDLFKSTSSQNLTAKNRFKSSYETTSEQDASLITLSARRAASEKVIQSICIGKMKEKFTKCECSTLPLCNTSLCLCRKNGVKCNFKCHRNSMCIWKH